MKGRDGNVARLERAMLRMRNREVKYLGDTRWDDYSLAQLIDEATDEVIDTLMYLERLRDALMDGGDCTNHVAGCDSPPHAQ